MKKKIKITIDGNRGSDFKNSYFARLLCRKYNLEFSSKPDLWIYQHNKFQNVINLERMKYNCIRVAYSGENTKLSRWMFDYSFSYEDTDNKNFYFPNFARQPGFQELKTQLYGDKVKGYRDYPKSRFCNFLYSNPGAKERINFTRKLMSYKKVDCLGEVLHNMPWLAHSLGYLAKIKLNFIKQHKFTIAFENASSPNYVTEKIFHALLVNNIPIYWGSPRIAEYFNPEAFINCHDYDSFDQVIERVIEVDNNDDLYQKYVNAPPVLEGSKVHAITEEAIMERLDKIVDSIGVVTPVCRTMPYRRRWVKAFRRDVRIKMNKALRPGRLVREARILVSRLAGRKSVGFVTLTNSGYFDYTNNLLKSMNLSGAAERLKIYCLDRGCHERFKAQGEDAVLINDKLDLSAFQKYRKGEWHHIVAHKLLIIYKNLLKNKYVLMIDGDIVFQSDKVIQYLLDNIKDNDVYIQNNGMSNEKKDRICSGFMFIRSSRKTINWFNPENIMDEVTEGWGDQNYVQTLVNNKNLKFAVLPLELFPNGRYFYENHQNINPYAIHFNWVKGHDKKEVMVKYGKWFG